MVFCQNCGANVAGRFCGSCGSSVGAVDPGASGSALAAASTPLPPTPSAPPPSRPAAAAGAAASAASLLAPTPAGRVAAAEPNSIGAKVKTWDESHLAVMDGLKRVYSQKIRPTEAAYKFDHFFSPLLNDADFDAKPMVLLMGQYSVGKTSFIKFLLERDFPGQRIGPEPTTDRYSRLSVCVGFPRHWAGFIMHHNPV